MSEEFKARLNAGEKMDCPCCGRWAQVYRRRIHHSAAKLLINLYILGGARNRRYVHASELIPKGNTGTGDIGKGIYWGLIEKMHLQDAKQKSSGYWRLTGLGCDFVEGKGLIKRTALIFDDRVLGFEGGDVDIKGCLEEKFNYDALMNGDSP